MDEKERMTDMVEEKIPVDMSPEKFEEKAHVELHKRGIGHEHHVDLMAEEYTLDEVARLVGTSREVVLHAVISGELKAERAGRDVVCIKHEDVVTWLRRRGGV